MVQRTDDRILQVIQITILIQEFLKRNEGGNELLGGCWHS